MSEATAAPEPTAGAETGTRGIDHWLVAAMYVAAAATFVLFYVNRYTLWQNGHLHDVLFGLWGLYWGVCLAWGALRIRPREGRTGFFHALFWVAGAQGFLLTLCWGMAWLDPDEPLAAIGYGGAAAFCAGPLLALGLAFVSRRRWVFLAAQVLGPALFLALWKFGG